MTEAEQRAAIAAEARTWIGTPYAHMGDGEQRVGRQLKGVAIDCAQILIEVYAAAGVIAWFSTGRYPRDWMLHQGEERYVGFIERFGQEFDWRVDPPQTADIVVWRYGRTFSHGAIVTEWPRFVHAFAPCRIVVEDPLDGSQMASREMRAFSLWAR